MAGLRNVECADLSLGNARCEVVRFTSLFLGTVTVSKYGLVARIGPVDPLERENKEESGRGVETGLS